jgi:hypothetical protein
VECVAAEPYRWLVWVGPYPPGDDVHEWTLWKAADLRIPGSATPLYPRRVSP